MLDDSKASSVLVMLDDSKASSVPVMLDDSKASSVPVMLDDSKASSVLVMLDDSKASSVPVMLDDSEASNEPPTTDARSHEMDGMVIDDPNCIKPPDLEPVMAELCCLLMEPVTDPVPKEDGLLTDSVRVTVPGMYSALAREGRNLLLKNKFFNG